MSSKYLRRYTDLPALIYLLTERKLTLLDPQSWDDRNDSHYLALYREKRRLKSVLALCFTQTAETYPHWRVFAPGSSGVCVRFTRSDLPRALKNQSGLRTGSVRYLKLAEIRNETLKTPSLPFLKRHAYEHEDEFRVIYESKTERLPKLNIDIPLPSIDRIKLSPWIHPALSPNVKRMLRSVKGCSALRIVRSTLISNEEWKTLGEDSA